MCIACDFPDLRGLPIGVKMSTGIGLDENGLPAPGDDDGAELVEDDD